MARIARVISANIPHHVTQRGNRRMHTFFRDEDYESYISLLGKWNFSIFCLSESNILS